MLFKKCFFIFLLESFLILGCSTDEEPDPSGTRGYISTEKGKVYFQGDILLLEGAFFNQLGLQRIEVFNEKLNIDFDLKLEGQVSFDLGIEYDLPQLEKPEIHQIVITVTSIDNAIRTFTYDVDYAFRPKIYNMRFSQDPDDPNIRYLHGRLEDPHGINSLQLNSLRIGDLIYSEFPEGIYSYDLNEPFWFPIVETFGEYPLTLQIINQRGFNLTIIDFDEILGD